MAEPEPAELKQHLENLYRQCNNREYVHPDPLEFLYRYRSTRDREIVGLIASSLAYGRVAQILKSVGKVLDIIGEYPYLSLRDSTYISLRSKLKGFKHRFADGNQTAALLYSIKTVIEKSGSLNACFLEGMSEGDENVIPGMTNFVNHLTHGKRNPGHLLALPEKGSACKRMNLFLRWMVRKDDVDPGGWEGIHPSKLIVPLDIHMHKIGLGLKLTSRRQASIATALEITSGFRKLSPDDPVKYDFALTRLGIRADMDMDDLPWLEIC
jgi:uncharacterized protein (TIGR02757 family)